MRYIPEGLSFPRRRESIRSCTFKGVRNAIFDVLKAKLAQGEAALPGENQSSNNRETFWDLTLRFRQQIEEEGIEFTDEDFADLRDRSPGREVEI